jgi:TonB family protein
MSATTFGDEPRPSPSVPRILGWTASAVLHGGALVFLLHGVPQHQAPAAPDVIALEMMAEPAAPPADATPSEPVMEQVQTVAPEATSATVVPPPPAATTTAETTAVPPPPEPVVATPPPDAAFAPPVEAVQAVQPEVQQATEPDAVPLEMADIPPPPPAPPPPPVRAHAPTPPPRPALRREAPPVATPPAAVQRSEAPPSPVTAAPVQAAPTSSPSRAAAGPPAEYVGRLFAAINRAKRYPQRARLRRSEGVVRLSVSVARDGTVVNWHLLQSSGDSDLDEEAVASIQRASLPPPPADLPGDPVMLIVPVGFRLR